MKKLILLLLTFISLNVVADCCICQTDTSPEEHIKWYKTGCKMWLMARGCPLGKVISQDDDIKEHIPKSCEGKKLKLGYVGHWSSSDQTIDYITKILGTLEEKNVSLYYDNTACLAMSNPQDIQDYLSKLKPKLNGREVSIKGNQAISTGMWDPILPGQHNFSAYTSTETENVAYPECHKLVDKGCWDRFQGGETGICIEKDNSKSILKCTKDAIVKYKKRKRTANGKSSRLVNAQRKANVWKRIQIVKDDFTILGGDDVEDYILKVFDPARQREVSRTFYDKESLEAFKEQLEQTNFTPNTYENIEFEKGSFSFNDIKTSIVDGKIVETEVPIQIYYVEYTDPITKRKIPYEFESQEKADQYISRIKKTQPQNKEDFLRSIKVEENKYQQMATVYNPDIGFAKRFKNGDEAKAYLKKLRETDQKGLNDLVYCNYLGK